MTLALIVALCFVGAAGLALSLIAAAVSLYLLYLLIFRLRMPCRICYTGNAINALLAVVWIIVVARG
jgi:uncharacterized membrane protein